MKLSEIAYGDVVEEIFRRNQAAIFGAQTGEKIQTHWKKTGLLANLAIARNLQVHLYDRAKVVPSTDKEETKLIPPFIPMFSPAGAPHFEDIKVDDLEFVETGKLVDSLQARFNSYFLTTLRKGKVSDLEIEIHWSGPVISVMGIISQATMAMVEGIAVAQEQTPMDAETLETTKLGLASWLPPDEENLEGLKLATEGDSTDVIGLMNLLAIKMPFPWKTPMSDN